MENLTETIINILEQTGIPKEQLKTNIDKLHRMRPYQPSSNTQSVILKFRSHNFKEKKLEHKKIYKRRYETGPITDKASFITLQIPLNLTVRKTLS